ncbi:MAG: AbrB family transcriptional regulator [Rhodoblastus sp.]
MSRPDPSRLGLPPFASEIFTVAGAALGGGAVAAVGVPAGWLSGAMIGVAILAALRLAEPLSAPFRWAAMVSSGVAIGAAVTPQMLQKIAAYPFSIAVMSASVAISTFACAKILARAPGWSRSTAFFASVPGALSYVFAVAATQEETDLSRIAVVQVLRVFLLMGFVPLIVAEAGGVSGAAPAGPIDPLSTLLVLAALGAAVGYAMERGQIAGGMLFGAMLVSGGAHALSLAPGVPPPVVAIVAQVLIGAWVGARFIGFDWRLFARSAPAALGSFFVAVGIAGVFAILAALALSLPFAQTLLAFSPGGLEAMTLLAFALGIDPLYVGAHHLARFLLISLTLPFGYKMWMRAKK